MAEAHTTPPPASETPPPSSELAVASDERFFAALGYFGPLFVLPLIVKPKSPFCSFHARQSMVLFLLTIIVLVVLAAIPWFGSLFTLGLFALYVLSIYRAYKGDLWKIPVVSGFAGKINVADLYGKVGGAVAKSGEMKDQIAQAAAKTAEEAKKLGEH